MTAPLATVATGQLVHTGPTVFLGLAVTGPVPGTHEVWELGLVERRADGTQHRRHMFPKPRSLANADPTYLTACRFYERTAAWDAHDGKLQYSDTPQATPSWSSPGATAAAVARATAGADLVVTNALLDSSSTAQFLERFLRASGFGPAWARVVDVDVLAEGFELGRGYRPVEDHVATTDALEQAHEIGRVWDAVQVGAEVVRR